MTQSAERDAENLQTLAEACSNWKAENVVADSERQLPVWVTGPTDTLSVKRLLKQVPRGEPARYDFVKSLLWRVKGSSLSKAACQAVISVAGLEYLVKRVEEDTVQWKTWEGTYSAYDYGDRPLAGHLWELKDSLYLKAGALDKAVRLKHEIAKRYDWEELPGGHSFYQIELRLHIHDVRSVELWVSDSLCRRKNVCLAGGVAQLDIPCRDDFIASLIMTCCLDEKMVAHIARIESEFYNRWRNSRYGKASCP